MPRQRATSPSEQSSRSWTWISTTAPIAGASPGSVSTPAAATPTRIISQVMPFGEIPVGRSSRVQYGEKRRMYSFPAQCSPLLRSKIDAGCVAARSSATEGLDVRVDTPPDLPLVEVEVLEDGVAIRPGLRAVGH